MGPLATATATLELTLDAATDRRTFETKISQIPCSSKMRPPDGCLQWFTGTDGQLTSFNFAANTGHLAQQNYNMCIRREAGFCCVKYGLCTDADSFSLESVKDMVAMQVGNDDELCLTDYLRIEGSSSTCGLGDATNRYDFQFFIRIPDSSILPLFSAIVDTSWLIPRKVKLMWTFATVLHPSAWVWSRIICLKLLPLWWLTGDSASTMFKFLAVLLRPRLRLQYENIF